MTNKAIRTTITFGDIELDVYQLPNGEYAFSKADLKKLSIQSGDKTGKKYLQPLLDKHSNRLTKTKAGGVKTQIHAIPLDIVTEIIQIYATLGNKKF